MSCSICYERFVAPVSLPCGHIFCRECIRRTVDSIKSCSVQHYCPTCRKPFCVVSIDPELVPPYLRPHIQSPIRPLFFDESVHSPSTSASASTSSSSQSQSQPTTSPTSPPLTNPSPFTASPTSASAPPPTTPSPIPIPISSPTPADLGRVTAAADALRLSCLTWRKRAEVHAAANAGLLGFARAAKESAQRMRVERDAARNECLLLKRKLAEVMAPPEWSDSDADSPLEGERPERMVGRAPAPRGLPVFLVQQKKSKAAAAFPPYDETTQSRFGPPIKRRRVGSCAPEGAGDAKKTSIAGILGGEGAGSQ